MKNNYLKQKLLVLGIALASVFITGVAALAQPNAVIIPTANTNTGSQRWPLGSWYGYERVSAIYTPAEVGFAGVIDTVGWYVNSLSSPAASTPVMIYMKEVSNTTFSTPTTVTQDTTNATLVFNGAVTSGQLVTNDWTKIKLTTQFAYSGSSNLQITVLASGGGSGIEGQFAKQFRYHSATSGSTQTWAADGSAPGGTGSSSSNRPNVYLDVFTAPMTYASSTVSTVTPPAVVRGTTTAQVVRLNVVTTGSVSPISLTSLDVSTNGTTSLSDISNLKVYYTGGSTTFSTTTQFGSTVASPSFSQTITGSRTLALGNNYFWITYDVSGSATAGNTIDAEVNSLIAGGITYVPSVTAPAGNRVIKAPMAGPYTVGLGGSFATLTDAMTELAVVGMSANVNLNIISDITEPAAVTIPQWTETGAGNYKMTISPTVPAIISANAVGTGVIVLNGADRVIIDGRISGSGNNLTIQNTNTSTTQMGIVLNSLGSNLGCVSDTIRNVTVKLGNTTANTCVAIQAQGDNNHNLAIMNNVINTSGIAINVFATNAPAGNYNNLLISGNVIGSQTPAQFVTFGGINVANAPYATIKGNTISYIFGNLSARLYGIQLNGYVTRTVISGNRIHSIINPSSSGFGTYGVNLASSTSADSVEISNNVITRMALYNYSTSSTTDNPFGIRITGGTRHRILFNSVNLYGSGNGGGTSGSLTAPLLITGGTNITVQNNIFANKYAGLSGTTNYCVYAASGVTFATINNNNYDTTGSGAYGRVGFLGSTYATLPAWKTATGQDVASYALTSSFTDDSTLTITSGATPSALESSAATGTGVTTDFNGDTRPKTVPTSFGGNTGPDIGAFEFDGTKADLLPPVITYTALPATTTSVINAVLSNVTITDASGINTTAGTKPRIYYKKASEANVFGGNTSGDNGWKYTEATNSTSPFSFTINYSILFGGSANLRDTIQYFVVAQDIAATPNMTGSPSVGLAGTTVGTITAAPTTPNFYMLVGPPMTGSFSVGAGQLQPNYVTITNAIKDLTLRGISGPVTFNLLDATYNVASGEQFPIVIGALTGQTPATTVTIRPDVGVTSTVSGSVANPLIRLDGAKYVIIDGRQGGSGTPKSLTLQNDNTSGAAVTFVNDATSNILRYAVFKGASTTATTGVINFNTGVTNGNDSNLIDNCNIGDAATTPATLIQAAGSTDGTLAKYNDFNTISNCNLFNFFNSSAEANAFKISNGNNSYTITGNSIYQTAARTTSSDHYTFNFQNSSNLNALNSCVITNNYIGGSAPLCAGTPWTMNSAAGRLTSYFNLGNLGMNRFSNNTFANFSYVTTSTTTTGTGSWCAVQYVNGMMNIDSNVFGSLTDTASIVLRSGSAGVAFMINATASSTAGTYSISSNKFGGIKMNGGGSTSNNLTLISVTSAGNNMTYNVNNNVIGNNAPDNIIAYPSSSTTAQSIRAIINSSSANMNITNNLIHNITNQYTSTGTGVVVGITSSGGLNNILNNTIDSLSNATTETGTTTSAAIQGIAFTSSNGGSVISQNKVFGLTSTAASANVSVTGIYYSGGTNDVISRNIVYGISTSSTSITSQQNGIVFGGGTSRVYNNMVRLGYNMAGAAQTVTPVMMGLSKTGGNIRAFFNTVYIGGTGIGTGAAKTYAFNKSSSGIDSVYNNVFANERSNNTTGGSHFAIALNNNTTLSIGSNVYWANGTGDTMGVYNNVSVQNIGVWNGVVAVDAASGMGNPQFIASAAATPDLHINAAVPSAVEGAGVSITGITDDYDGQTRASFTATDIGADAGNFIPNDVVAPLISYTALTNTAATGDRVLTATITDKTGVQVTTGGFLPVIYYKKFNAGIFNVANGTKVSGTAQNGTWNFTISSSALGGLALGDSIYYYVVAQDSSANTNLGSLPFGAIGSNVNVITTEPAKYTYKIVPGLGGNITVGATGTYPTLTGVGGAFEAINASAITSNVTLTIVSDLLEDGTNGINQWSEGGAGNYTLSIVPDGTTERLVVGSSTTGLIRLNGADRVKIDGRFSGSGRYLRFRNRAQAGVTFMLQNDAHRDTISYCFIEGVNNTTGTILFGTSNIIGGTGNDSNGVNNCVIRDTLGTTTGNIPNTGLSSSGSSGLENSENTINNNEFFNFGFNGLNLNATGTGDNWKINNNTFYQTAIRSNSFKVILVTAGNNQTITGNSIGGAANDRSGAPFQTNTTSTTCFTGIYINGAAGLTGYNVANNTIANVFANSAGNDHSFVGIEFTAPSGTITGNTIGGGVNAWDTVRCDGDSKGIRNTGAGTVTISNNTVAYLTNQSTGNDYMTGIELSAGTNTVTGNTVHHITQLYTTSTFAGYACTGIGMNLSTGNNTITKNTVYDITNLTTAASTYAGGITYTTSGGVNNVISANRVYRVRGNNTVTGATGSSSTIVSGIYVSAGPVLVVNNQVAIGSNATDEARIAGIRDESSTANQYYYNSVFVNGNTGSGANSSYGMYRTNASSTLDVRNNIFYNKRTTSGAGFNFSVGSTSVTGITAATFMYNLLAVNNMSALLEMPTGVNNDIAAFNGQYALNNTYNTNWMETVANLSAQNLFTDTAVGNLGIVTTNPASWYVNGKGIAITGQSGDFSNASGVRSVTIAAGTSDIGSVEFTTATTPPSATASGAPSLNGTTTYTFAGRQVTSVTWGAAGTVPTALDVKYYTGVTAPSLLPSKTQFNSYYVITPTGGTGYTYNITLAYDSASMGNVTSSANARMAHYKSPSWNLRSTSSANAVTGMLAANTSLAASTLPANFTGTDNTNPLPVEMLSFTANAQGNDVLLSWSTATEINNKGFDVERSVDGRSFKALHFVNGNGNTSIVSNYADLDAGAFSSAASNTLYYRLKQVDLNGNFTYTDVVKVTKSEVKKAVVAYPNPFRDNVTISLPASEGTANVAIMDLSGRVITAFSVDLQKGSSAIEVKELADLQSGIYFAKVVMNGEAQVIKLVKTN